MKKVKLGIVILMAIWMSLTAIFYFAGAFYEAALNISLWEKETRSIVVIFWVLFMIIGSAVSFMLTDD